MPQCEYLRLAFSGASVEQPREVGPGMAAAFSKVVTSLNPGLSPLPPASITTPALLDAMVVSTARLSSNSRLAENLTTNTRAAAANTVSPMNIRAWLVARDSILNRNPTATAPALPPAPTIPATEPSALVNEGHYREHCPSDICTKRLKTIIITLPLRLLVAHFVVPLSDSGPWPHRTMNTGLSRWLIQAPISCGTGVGV